MPDTSILVGNYMLRWSDWALNRQIVYARTLLKRNPPEHIVTELNRRITAAQTELKRRSDEK